MTTSGQVVSRPSRKHQCAPGWKNYYAAEQDGLGFGPGWYSSPPDASEYPKGTVWQCACGQAWVSTGPPAGRGHGVVNWHKESRWARRRRERKCQRG